MLLKTRSFVRLFWFVTLWAACSVGSLSSLGAAPPRPILALQNGHSGWVVSIAFSPDGRLAATGSEDKTVRIWNVRSGEMLATLAGYRGRVEKVQFAPNGRMLANFDAGDPGIRLWDTRTGSLLATIPGSVFAFSPDSTRLAVTLTDAKVHLWDLRTLRPGGVSAQSAAGDGMVTLRALAFSPDGMQLAIGGESPLAQNFRRGTATVLDARSLKALRTVACREPITHLAFAASGKSLLTANTVWPNDARASEVCLWNTQTGRLQAKLLGNSAGVVFNMAAAGNVVAMGNASEPGTVRTFDMETGHVQREWKALPRSLDRIVLSPDGRRLAAFAWAQPFIVWDLVTGKRVTDVPDLRAWIAPETVFSPDGHLLAASGGNNDARLWSADTGRLAVDLRGQPGTIESIALAPDGETVAEACDDQVVRLWNLRTGRLRSALSCPEGTVHAVAFAPNGLLAASAGDRTDSGHLYLWNVQTGALVASAPTAMTGYALTFSPDSSLLAMGSIAQELHGKAYATGYNFWSQTRFGGGSLQDSFLWNIKDGMRLSVLTGRSEPDVLFAFSPDSRQLATGSNSPATASSKEHDKAQIQLADVSTAKESETLHGLGHVILTAAYAPDGRTLATGSQVDGNMPTGRLWDAVTGKLRATLESPRFVPGKRLFIGPLVALAYSPDGRILAGSVAGQVRLWNPGNGHLLAVLDEPRDFVKGLAFSADGRRLATLSEEYRTRIWDIGARKQISVQQRNQLAEFPPQFRAPLSTEGAALVLHDPRDGRILVRMIHIPAPEGSAASGAQAATIGDLWFAVTPEGYFDGSPDAARYIKWNVKGVLYPAERYLRRFRRPDILDKALRGETVEAPGLTLGDVPPSVQIAGYRDGDTAPSDPLNVSVETRGLRSVKQVEILVNGRPLSPGEARPIEADARPIEADARQPESPARIAQRFSFRVSLPEGAKEIHLQIVAYDETDIGSDPVEITLHRTGVQEVTGNLYVLSIGVSQYLHGSGSGEGARGQFHNLRYPSADAQSIAARFAAEGPPLYSHVEVRSLVDAQATLANLREGLRWLQESVGPGQIDTVVLYLSGHGMSTESGQYYFAPYDFDLHNIARTALSGSELREALGGRMRARRVFLFVDTCHAGALSGRSEDLVAALGEGVFIIASSGANEYAYESDAWGHGAFTLGLLRSLARKDLEDNGTLRFVDLVSSLRREVAALLRASGRNDTEQEPCVPLAGRHLGEPIAHSLP